MQFTLFTADCTGNPRNRIYAKRLHVTDPQKLQYALWYDHVCAEYRGYARSNEGFLESNVIVMDVDNDHTENPRGWITGETMEQIFADVNYALATSRNHNKQKGGKSPRPRFHVYFPISRVTDADAYASIKEELAARFGFFDENALDAARFIFGCEAHTIWHEGTMNVDAWLKGEDATGGNYDETAHEPTGQVADPMHRQPRALCEPEGEFARLDGTKRGEATPTENPAVEEEYPATGKSAMSASSNIWEKLTPEDIATAVERGILPEGYIIPEGERNDTMYHIALRILTRYGNDEQSHQSYLREAERCYPPLPNTELQRTWNSALNSYEKYIKTNPNYILPKDWDKQLYGASHKRHRKGDAMTHDSGIAADSPSVGTSPRQLPAGRANSPDGSNSALCGRYIGEAPDQVGSYADSAGITSYNTPNQITSGGEHGIESVACTSEQLYWSASASHSCEEVARDTVAEQFPRLRPNRYSDQDQAILVAREMRSQLMYNPSMGLMRYNGTCWEANEIYAFGAIMDFMDMQIEDAEAEYEYCRRRLTELGVPPDFLEKGKLRKKAMDSPAQQQMIARYEAAKEYRKFAMEYRSHRLKVSVQNELYTKVQRPMEDLDRDGFLLNTPESTWNLAKGMDGRQPHNWEDTITNVTACDPGEEGKELWEEALQTFFCNDRELIDYVQEIVGMAAVGKVYMEAMIIAYGGGRNGKSTFWNAIARVLGTYSGSLSTDTLSLYCRRNVKPEMAELKGKRLVIASELESGSTLSTSMLKQLCSTDPIYAEKKFMAPFFFTPTHTLVLYTNHLPKVKATDEGTWRRLIVIPFNAVIPSNNDVRNYGDYLVEHAGPAILQWVIEGAQRMIAKQFQTDIPPAVLQVTEGFRKNNDTISEFLEQCCEIGEEMECKSGELYKAYQEFCRTNGTTALSGVMFSARLEQLGFTKKRKNTGMMIIGVNLLMDYLSL